MSVLQIVAILGILLGSVSFVLDKRKRPKWIFIALVIFSAMLLIVSVKAERALLGDRQSVSADGRAAQDAGTIPDDSVNVVGEVAGTGEGGDNEFDMDSLVAAQDAKGQPDNDGAPEPAPAQPEAEPAGDAAPSPEPAGDAVPSPEPAGDAVPSPEPAGDAAPSPEPAGDAAPIQNAEDAPLANAGKDISDAKVNEVISFSGKRSKKNPKGSAIKSYAWDFGDGTTASTAEAKHAYANVGTYKAILTVTDADGRMGKAVRTIDVNRPESKVRSVTKKLNDEKEVTTSPAPLTGTVTKSFTGSSLTLEASGYMLASDGCTCEIALSINGPGCSTGRSKDLKDGGEGNLTVRASCKGEPGEFSWNVSRKVTGSCACTFANITVEVYEN